MYYNINWGSNCLQSGVGYQHGFWKWVYTDKLYTKGIKRARWANRFDENMLLSANKIYCMSPML